jgi:hypothetical protein
MAHGVSPCAASVRLAVAALLLSAAAASAQAIDPSRFRDSPAGVPDAADQLTRVVKDLGLSLFPGPLGSSLVLPLGGTGVLRPYAAIGGTLGVTPFEDRLAPYENLARPGESAELGAGFSWRLTDRLELFGEYRFLSIRPASDDSGRSTRDADSDTQIQGGLSIRF